MTTFFNDKLTDILKTDLRFVDDEGELVRAAVIDRAWKIDRGLMKLLLDDARIKEKFFRNKDEHLNLLFYGEMDNG